MFRPTFEQPTFRVGLETGARMMVVRLVSILFIFIFVRTACAGDVLNVLTSDMKPLLQSDRGKIQMCGVHFSAALSGSNELLALQGSANLSFYKGRLPAVAVKFLVVRGAHGQLIPQRLTHAFLMKGGLSTAAFPGLHGEDGNSWLAFNQPPHITPEQMIKFIEAVFDNPFIGFNFGVGRDYTFQLPAPESSKIYEDVMACVGAGLDQLIRENQ